MPACIPHVGTCEYYIHTCMHCSFRRSLKVGSGKSQARHTCIHVYTVVLRAAKKKMEPCIQPRKFGDLVFRGCKSVEALNPGGPESGGAKSVQSKIYINHPFLPSSSSFLSHCNRYKAPS